MCAESFLVDKKPVRRRTRQQLKHEITELMGSVIEQSSQSLEKEAKIQQKLCKELRASVEGSKGMLSRASQKDLQQMVASLRKEQQRRAEQLVVQNAFLANLS